MDQFSAHLDRGWDLAQKGDAAGAIACARRALELDPKSPDVYNLLGFSTALSGEADEALEFYKQALTLDENYFEAMLNAAELMLTGLNDPDGALAFCNDAGELAETDQEVADCVLLKVDALMMKHDDDEARKTLMMLPEGAYTNASYAFLIGRAYYELGEPERAAPLIEEAARIEPEHADAHYYLGLVRDEKGDVRGATEAFLRTRSLDAMMGPPPWAPSSETFTEIVRGAIAKLDVILARFVTEAEVYVVDLPGAELVVDGVDPRALLFLDTPVDEQGGKRARMFVYQRNIERAAKGIEEVEAELTGALEREITSIFLDQPDRPATAKHELN